MLFCIVEAPQLDAACVHGAQVRVLTNKEKFKVLVKKSELLTGHNGSFLQHAGHFYVKTSYLPAKYGLFSNSYLSNVVGCR